MSRKIKIKTKISLHRFFVFMALTSVFLSVRGIADDWASLEQVSFVSCGYSYVAEIFPPKSRQNPGDKPLCYFYEMGYPGTEWKIQPHLLWKAQLVNKQMPYQAVVSMDGFLVTLNDHGQVGYNNA